MTNQAENLIDWLHDAYAIEEKKESWLKGQADQIGYYPEFSLRIKIYLKNTARHQEAIKNCLQRLIMDNSIKSDSVKLLEEAKNVSSKQILDEKKTVNEKEKAVKETNTLFEFAHVAISSYEMIVAAAEAIGDIHTANISKYLLDDELAMSTWLKRNLSPVAQLFSKKSSQTPAFAI